MLLFIFITWTLFWGKGDWYTNFRTGRRHSFAVELFTAVVWLQIKISHDHCSACLFVGSLWEDKRGRRALHCGICSSSRCVLVVRVRVCVFVCVCLCVCVSVCVCYTLKWHQGTWVERKAGIASCPKAYALPSGPVGLGRASGHCLGFRAQLDRLMWE